MHALHLCFMLLTSAYLPVATKTKIYGGFEGIQHLTISEKGLRRYMILYFLNLKTSLIIDHLPNLESEINIAP